LRYSVEPTTTAEGLASLESDWNRLSGSAPSPNVFMTYDWFRAWNQLCLREPHRGVRRPNVLVLKKDSVVAGISPLIYRETSRFGLAVRKLEFVGEHSDYNDLVLGNDPAGQIKAIVDFLIQAQDRWDLVDLRDLREAGMTRALMEGALSHTRLLYRILPEKGRCPYLSIGSDSATIMAGLSGHVRRTLRKRMERARALGLRTRIIENPHEERGLLARMIAVEHQKHLHGKLSRPFVGEYRDVFQSLFDTLGPHGWIYIALMEQGDHLVAWQVGFRCGKALWDYNKAYDPVFSQLAPGTILVPSVLDYGLSHGFEEYDFLRGEEPYKMIWSSGHHDRFRLLIRNPCRNSRARAFVYLDLKEAVYRLFGKRD